MLEPSTTERQSVEPHPPQHRPDEPPGPGPASGEQPAPGYAPGYAPPPGHAPHHGQAPQPGYPGHPGHGDHPGHPGYAPGQVPGVPQGHAPYAHAHPAGPYAQRPPAFNGTPLFVRTLMIIGAGGGLLGAAWLVLLTIIGEPRLLVSAAVLGLYGTGSLVLVLLAKRRSPAVRWSILAFHVVALVSLIATHGSASGAVESELDPGGTLRAFANLLVFVVIVLIAVPASGPYYRRTAEQPFVPGAPGGYGPPPSAGPYGQAPPFAPPYGPEQPHGQSYGQAPPQGQAPPFPPPHGQAPPHGYGPPR